jgi:hypothetical protein
MKKKILTLFLAAYTNLCLSQVTKSVLNFKNDKIRDFQINLISADFSKIKFKLFIKNSNGPLPYMAFLSWSKNKNIYFYSSCAYVDDCDVEVGRPVGLSINNHEIINKVVEPNILGLCLINKDGEMQIKNLKSNLNIENKNNINITDAYYKYKIIDYFAKHFGNSFQSHLLWYNNQNLALKYKSSPSSRRALVITRDKNKIKEIHTATINSPISLKDFSTSLGEYFHSKMYIIDSIIYLDTGCQDVFGSYTEKNKFIESKEFTGRVPIQNTSTLLVAYQ